MTEEMTPIGQETLERVLERLQIDKDKTDYLLVGDGSGSNWNTSAGWGCVSIAIKTGQRQAWYGGMSKGTVNLAEMMAYIQPLSWISAQRDKERKEEGTSSFCRVHIITDSQYCQGQGDKKVLRPKKNGTLWRIFSDFERNGILLNWHWLGRDDVELNRLADAMSKAARRQFVPPKGQVCPVLAKAHKNASGVAANSLDQYNPPEGEKAGKPAGRRTRRKPTKRRKAD